MRCVSCHLSSHYLYGEREERGERAMLCYTCAIDDSTAKIDSKIDTYMHMRVDLTSCALENTNAGSIA